MDTVLDLRKAIRRGDLSSRELLESCLAQIQHHNPTLNAVVTLDADRARVAADAADRVAARGEWAGPLHGLPFTVKDALSTAGLRTTHGVVAHRDNVPVDDAFAVAALRGAGAILLGKTNTPPWASGLQTRNEIFGTTRHPHDPSRTPGGSSGGSAVAVVTGMSTFELGTDMGGSLRAPAGFCGVHAHKPTFGLVPQNGYLGLGEDVDMNVLGPMARTAEDLNLLLSVLIGSAGRSLPPPRHERVGDYRVGLWLDDPSCQVSSEVGDVLTVAAATISAAGVTIVDRPPIDLADASAQFRELLTMAALAQLAPGTRPGPDLERARARLCSSWDDYFRTCDVLICPVTPMAAFPHDSRPAAAQRVNVDGRSLPHQRCLSWVGLASAAYLPATVIPAGHTPEGLPVGLQIIGPRHEDRTPLRVAEELSELLG